MSISKSDLIKLLKSWIGRNEKDGTHKPIIDIYNTQKKLPRNYKVQYTDEWCATTVTAAFVKLGATDLIYPECGCEEMIKGLKSMGIWIEDESITPEVGDLVFFDWQDTGKGDDKGWADHVGVVVEVSGNRFKTIEGNRGNAVSYREYTVNQKQLRGFARPKYKAEAVEVKPAVRYYKKYKGKSVSIVDGLNAIGVGSSYSLRSKIAKANGIKDYRGTAEQNTKMLNLLKSGKLIQV